MSKPTLRVILTDRARRQLSDALVYSEQRWGREQRRRYGQILGDALRAIAENPAIGRRRDELAEGLRSYAIRSHILYYWIRDQQLVVAQILHAREDVRGASWDEPTGADDE